jgi:hypothetical protein
MTRLQQWTFPAESREWVGPITLTVGNAPVATFEVAVVKRGVRPYGPWTAPTTAEYTDDAGATRTGAGVLITPDMLAVGSWHVLARPTGPGLESPVVDVGVINIV